ncbi:hypothetical protein BDM02DRAFT_604046 [Thelephora ganbajun]|uniref:Uncharacterized protein n=1 Tax=Thelephora ganbajun TaxID=370292 RepID=A0ACB6Z7E6_THEGA|nr:hypothetical protein BDM02DRAFT_604046 [Thelephora ganbajun]
MGGGRLQCVLLVGILVCEKLNVSSRQGDEWIWFVFHLAFGFKIGGPSRGRGVGWTDLPRSKIIRPTKYLLRSDMAYIPVYNDFSFL